MKKFNLSKGLLIGLLTLALCFTMFGYVKASAGDTEPEEQEQPAAKYTVTLNANGGTGTDKVEADKESPYTLPTSLPSGWAAPAGKVFDGWALTADGDKITGTTTTLTADTTLYAVWKSYVLTFSLTPTYGTEITGVTYVYAPGDDFVEKNTTLSLADIIDGAKVTAEGDNKDKTIAEVTDTEAADWIVSTVGGANTVTNINALDALKNAGISYSADGSFKLTKNLNADANIAIALAPAKVNITFTVTVDDVPYKSTFAVENNAKTKTKISYYDIASGLKATVAEEEVTLDNQVVIKVGDTAQTGDYSKSAYEVANNVLKTEDFTDVAILVADAFTDKTGYDPATDSIYFESPVQITVYWTDCKKAAGVQLKGSQLKTLALAENKETKKFEGSIPLNDKDAGVKIAENKTAYIYASIKAPAEDKTKYSANFVVDATPYKKIAVTFAYALATKDEEFALDPAIATITTIDNKKKTVVYSGEYDKDTNPDHFLEYMLGGLQFSTDGTTWYDITGNKDPKTGKPANNLDLGTLYDLANGGSKTTLYFRIKGDCAHPEVPAEEVDNENTPDYDETEGKAATNAYRACKPIKATVSAAKDTKALKINVATGTIALKNGYDFAVTKSSEKGKNEPSFTKDLIYTVLPFNKNGAAKTTVYADENDTEGTKVDTEFCDTIDFVPAKKCTKDTAGMFTNIKVKSLEVSEVCGLCEETPYGTGQIYLWVRKSATESKPADKWVLITLDQIKDAPIIKADSKTKYYSVQDTADTKGVLATPEISSAKGDSNSGYEYLIIDAKDVVKDEETSEYYANIDFTTAKWTTLNDKGLTVGKSKSKYSNDAKKKASAYALKDGAVVLVRRAGDKNSNLLPSKYIVTTVVKETVTLQVENSEGKKEDKEFKLFVWKAYSAD